MFSSKKQKPPTPPARVTFDSRLGNGYGRDDLESIDMSSVDFRNYRVQFPMTPDNRPMAVSIESIHPLVSAKVDEHYAASSLFTGGFNSVTRAHLMDKITDPAPAGGKVGTCAVEGCDGKVMCDERGDKIYPCECEFKICHDCFVDAVKNGGRLCTGCKEPYKVTEVEELTRIAKERKAIAVRPLPEPKPQESSDRRLSVVNSMKGGEFDRWLFETKGTYGYGNAIWPENSESDGSGDGIDGEEGGSRGGGSGRGVTPKDLASKAWRPLTRKLQIPAAILSPYRFVLILFVYN
ncbi:hypothetical protein HPP92_022062 [Vanilla planifolia]|uniref:Cellulose synthase-like protein D3 n=1 Tax=Vanilla planifolia TaxID=51239 RepID=A0A835PMU8_VANPL|nr:hypothetical protein HPP92_022062 [Vanilla planifolia]